MEPLLTKNEIADLLAALHDDEQNPVTIARPNNLRSKVKDQGIEVKDLNLFQLNSSIDGQHRLPNLNIILDTFAQIYSISLTNQLQRTFYCLFETIDSTTLHNYLEDRKNAVGFGVLKLSPLKHDALLSFSPELSFAIVEILLGASINLNPLQLKRKLTVIEMNLLRSVMTAACNAFDRAMKPLLELNSSLLTMENDSRLVAITSAKAEVLVSRFTVKIGQIEGRMEIAFPLSTFTPLRKQFKNLPSILTRHDGWADQIISNMGDLPLTLIAQSGDLNLPIRQILAMKKGDIIDLDYDPNASTKVLIEDQLKFFAIPGIHNTKKTIHLTGTYEKGANHGSTPR